MLVRVGGVAVALGFSAWLWFVSLVALGISSVDFSDPSECFPSQPLRPVRVLPRPSPVSLAVGGFGCSCSVVSVRSFVPSLFRFVCPLWVFRPCTGRIKLPSLPRYIVEPVGSHPVVISGRSCFPSCVCLPVVSSSSLARFRPFRPSDCLPSCPCQRLGGVVTSSEVSFVLRPPSKWGQLSIFKVI